MKSIIQFTFIISGILFLSSCVPQRKFVELQDKYNALNSDHVNLDSLHRNLKLSYEKLNKDNDDLRIQYTKLQTDFNEMEVMYERVKKTYEQLTENYKRHIESSSMSKDELKKSLRELEEKLQKKELELNEKEANLIRKEEESRKLNKDIELIEKDLKEREEKVKELEQLLKQKDESVAKLKETLTNALMGYKKDGLSVTSRDGKVYVSVDESLLFQSGRTDVNPLGKKALLKLCETLKQNTDFSILIEGHTDDVPVKTARFEDNWDLSVLRATSVTRIMIKEGGIDPLKIIPAGRGEYIPVDAGKSVEARAKNRRIEIILAPELKEIMKILNK